MSKLQDLMCCIYTCKKQIFKGSNNDIQAEQKDDGTEYAVWEDDDNEEEENKGQIECIFYINAWQLWIHINIHTYNFEMFKAIIKNVHLHIILVYSKYIY